MGNNTNTIACDYDAICADARTRLEERLTEFRLLHSLSVSETAQLMAHAYGVDTDEARAAGLLHDWDKCFSDEELIARAKKFGIKLMKHHEDTAPLLHAQTGAAAVAAQYPELPKSVIQAIERHTSAAPDMQPLDMIIYIADMIEPLRTQGNLEPLRKLAGNAPLEALFVKCYEVTMQHLISRHRFIHPDSIKVWNAYVSKERSTAEKAAQSLRDVKIDV